MLYYFEKNNEEGKESRRGIIAMKYFRIWKGESSVDQFIAMKEQFEKEMVKICETEIQEAHESCFETKQILEYMFTGGLYKRKNIFMKFENLNLIES